MEDRFPFSASIPFDGGWLQRLPNHKQGSSLDLMIKHTCRYCYPLVAARWSGSHAPAWEPPMLEHGNENKKARLLTGLWSGSAPPRWGGAGGRQIVTWAAASAVSAAKPDRPALCPSAPAPTLAGWEWALWTVAAVSK